MKLALARQCGDEAKHYRLIEARLRELGVDPSAHRPPTGAPSPMFQFLAGLDTTVERVAAGQFTREALALVQNQVFIELLRGAGRPRRRRASTATSSSPTKGTTTRWAGSSSGGWRRRTRRRR